MFCCYSIITTRNANGGNRVCYAYGSAPEHTNTHQQQTTDTQSSAEPSASQWGGRAKGGQPHMTRTPPHWHQLRCPQVKSVGRLSVDMPR
ncbi:hypothetical protein RB195_025952 [Necator americanus]|uniref:Uncharacterized protein n=1 Tax=Necator americanus TaxID=51031 RepID=A0ABR1EUL3_NECAM